MYLHWRIARYMGVYVAVSWLKQKPVDSMKKEGIELMWDMKIVTDIQVPANMSDIILHD